MPSSSLSIASRAALFWLADAAPTSTGLAWISQANLSSLIGCAPTYVAAALAPIEAAGLISIYRRSGRSPFYLIHPEGRHHLAKLAARDVRAHLRAGHLPRADIAAALSWLAQIGALAADGAAAATLQHSRTVGNADRTPFKPVEPHCSTQSKGTLRHSRNKPKENPKETQIAGTGPTRYDGMATNGGRAGTPGAILGGGAASRVAAKRERDAWRGEPAEVLATLIAAGGREGEKLAAMPPAEALAAVERQQHLLRLESPFRAPIAPLAPQALPQSAQ